MCLDRVRRIEEALWSGCRLGSGNGCGGCAVVAARSGGAEISVRDLPGGEAAEATAGTGADPVAAAAVYG